MRHCVYKHTFPNGKVYIGQTKSGETEQRWSGGWGYNGQIVFDAIVKYGWNNIRSEILEDDISDDDIDQREAFYIAKYHAANRSYGYNVKSMATRFGELNPKIDEPKMVSNRKPSGTDDPIMMKLRPASEKFGISYDRLRKWCLAGEVSSVRSGRDLLINTSDLKNILSNKAKEESA